MLTAVILCRCSLYKADILTWVIFLLSGDKMNIIDVKINYSLSSHVKTNEYSYFQKNKVGQIVDRVIAWLAV